MLTRAAVNLGWHIEQVAGKPACRSCKLTLDGYHTSPKRWIFTGEIAPAEPPFGAAHG
jgi:hypothetical protein